MNRRLAANYRFKFLGWLPMKTCFKCGIEKPLSEFYKHKMMADGHLNKCKDCTKRDVALHRKDNIEKVREYDRNRANLPHRVQLRTSNTAAYRKRFPERAKANAIVARALKNGSLGKLPCFMCGASRVEAHHPAYSLPLDVVWLCAEHHREIHLAYPDDYYEHQTIRTELPEWQRERHART